MCVRMCVCKSVCTQMHVYVWVGEQSLVAVHGTQGF